jgi:1-acyl-sn-glycerol-3-phosphate acyltransferase
MADGDPLDPDQGQTVELALSEIRGGLPSAPEDLRDALPGLEPDRHNTDWGRSERIGRLADRTLFGFLYHYWFRVEVEGVENVPASGGALLIANHGGAIPPDGAMIAKAIREEHSAPRPLHVMTGRRLAATPAVGMLMTKLGGVAAHPANLHRLLFDERELVLAFPEGGGRSKSLSERYRLRHFGDGAYVEAAMRAHVPIVPVAVVGSEEATPVFARVSPLRRLTRLPSLPLSPAVPLPAKFRIRFLEPATTDELGAAPWEDHGLVQALSHDIRALIQENLFEMVSERRSVWLG